MELCRCVCARAFPTRCGHLGGERDPLSGIFLIPLGMPWTLFIGSAGKFDPFGGVSPAVLAMLAPAINLAILFSICCTLCRRFSIEALE